MSLKFTALVAFVTAVTSHATEASSFQAIVDEIVKEKSQKYDCAIAASVYLPSENLNVTSAYGKVSFEQGARDVSTAERFVWGSITKVSTGTAILRLVEDGKIGLDDTIPQYIDPLIAQMHKASPTKFNYTSSSEIWGSGVNSVTVRHLAEMRSGIPDFDTAKPYPPPPTDPLRAEIYNTSSQDYTPPELMSVPWVALGKLLFPPGTKEFSYSSTNFMLLGLILANQSGADSWDTYDQTTFLPDNIKRELQSIEYVKTGSPADVTPLHGYDRTSYNRQNPRTKPGIDVHQVHGVFGGWTASDFTSTVADAAAFAYDVYGPESRLLKPASQQVMIPKDDIYGFATFNISRQTGYPAPMGTAYGHIGATYGYDSTLTFHPALNATITIASNMENDDQTHPSDTLCSLFSALKNHVKGTNDICSYKPRGYYGGECKCTISD
jgi:D-alanyl-D-alanine carboxypeptidase